MSNLVSIATARARRREKQPAPVLVDLPPTPGQSLVGVRMLWAEVLRRAAFDWVLYRGSRKKIRAVLASDAERWLFSDESGVNPETCSFLWVCDALDLDPQTIRNGILKLTAKRIKTLGRLPVRRIRVDTTAEPGHDDIEVRVSWGHTAKFVQEVRLLGGSFDDQEL